METDMDMEAAAWSPCSNGPVESKDLSMKCGPGVNLRVHQPQESEGHHNKSLGIPTINTPTPISFEGVSMARCFPLSF